MKVAVAAGELLAGEAVPSVRELARRLRVNPATVAQAYRELASEGFLETRHGSGTFVREITRERRDKEIEEKARELVRSLLEEGARLGISAGNLADAFEEEVGSKVND